MSKDAGKLGLGAFPRDLMVEVWAEAERSSGRRFPFPPDLVRGVALVTEEAGELIRSALNASRGPRSTETLAEVRVEALHTAATAVRLILAIDLTAGPDKEDDSEDYR